MFQRFTQFSWKSYKEKLKTPSTRERTRAPAWRPLSGGRVDRDTILSTLLQRPTRGRGSTLRARASKEDYGQMESSWNG